MPPAELTQYLRTQIPLTQAMGITVASIEADAVALQAPLAPNINHRHSVFGGSAAALAMLAGWALLHVRLRAAGIPARVVIQRNTMEYRHPIVGPFIGRATLEHPERWQLFTRTLLRRGKARIAVSAALGPLEHMEQKEHMERVSALFAGEFVASLNDLGGTP